MTVVSPFSEERGAGGFGSPIVVRSSRGDYRVVETTRSDLLLGLDALVTDANVAAALGPISIPHLVLPAGEATKSLARFGETLSWLAARGVHRRSVIGALGGGVIGDLVGFAASSYMRGVRYVQIPTTLLAMVDSSVGGKVAVDLPEGKNLAGAFHPPIEVRLDLTTLRTLPPREFAAGMAEVVKTFAISDADSFDRLAGEPEIAETVRACVDFKRRIVEEDEDETKGLRAILNFGHTIGHAIEAVTEYRRFLHGEAVAIGMVAEAHLGERLGLSPEGTSDRLVEALEHIGLPTELPSECEEDALIAAMRRDKKAQAGNLAFALLEKIGSARFVPDVEESVVREVLRS